MDLILYNLNNSQHSLLIAAISIVHAASNRTLSNAEMLVVYGYLYGRMVKHETVLIMQEGGSLGAYECGVYI